MADFPKPVEFSLDADSPRAFGAGRLAGLDHAREPLAVALLSLAFRDNPMNRAVIGKGRDRRLLVNSYGMTASLVATRRFSFRRVALSEPQNGDPSRGEAITGTLIALDPGGYPAGPPPIGVQMRCLWGQGIRVMRRWAQLYRLLDDRHPKAPHCYLALIATHPERRGLGIGRALLEDWLADVDARAMPSYLETDRRELVAFYQSAGFGVECEFEAFGTPVWCMSRPAIVGKT